MRFVPRCVEREDSVGMDGSGWWETGRGGWEGGCRGGWLGMVGGWETRREDGVILVFSPLQCVPAGVLPLLSAPSTQTSSSFQAPPEFEDVMQMIEWLILIESKLQPEKITVGDFVQLRKLLRDIQVQESIVT